MYYHLTHSVSEKTDSLLCSIGVTETAVYLGGAKACAVLCTHSVLKVFSIIT